MRKQIQKKKNKQNGFFWEKCRIAFFYFPLPQSLKIEEFYLFIYFSIPSYFSCEVLS